MRRAWTPNLDDFSRYSGFRDCLEMLWQQAGAAGVYVEELLLPYQSSLYRDLRDGVDESALAHVYDWWNYDLSAIMARRRWENDQPRPRIELELELSTRGNLKCEWRPLGLDRWGNLQRGQKTDWASWFRLESRSGGWDSRPSNELFFIHEVERALLTIRYPREDARPARLLDHVLLHAIVELMKDLKHRLGHHFDVTMRSDIFVEYEPNERGVIRREADRIVAWEIDDPERRQNEQELAELASLKQRLGFTEEHFLELWAEVSQKKRSGPPPLQENVSPKVAKALRAEGLRDITASDTNRVRYLIDKHRPKNTGGPSATIIPIRR